MTHDRGAGRGSGGAGLTDVQGAPWKLVGQSVVALVRGSGRGRGGGVARGRSVAVVVAASYQSSPVGPFRELAIAVPARVGLRPGLTVIHQVVDSAAARLAYRAQWDLPTELGTMRWSDGALAWEERGIVVRGVPLGMRFPLAVPIRMMSSRGRPGGRTIMPRRLWSLVQAARVIVDVDASSPAEASVPLAWLAGTHPGVVLSGTHITALGARVPAGVFSSLRVRPILEALGGTEPGLLPPE